VSAVRRTQGRGAAATLLGFSLLVVFGFSAGVIGGLLWEEPGLVLAYVTGKTEEVAWTTAAEIVADSEAKLPPVAAPPKVAGPVKPAPVAPVATKPALPAPTSQPKVKPEAPKPPVVAAVPAGRIAVQVGAFADSGAAERLAERLRGRDYPVYVAPGSGPNARWRVRVGPLADRTEAERLAARLKRNEKLPTWIMEEDGG